MTLPFVHWPDPTPASRCCSRPLPWRWSRICRSPPSASSVNTTRVAGASLYTMSRRLRRAWSVGPQWLETLLVRHPDLGTIRLDGGQHL